MTGISGSELKAGRELDALVAEKVMGLKVHRLTPPWYRREVTLFLNPVSGLVEYSYDENSCNAIMFRNGVDDRDGSAPPLPHFSLEMEDAWPVVEEMRARIAGRFELIEVGSITSSADSIKRDTRWGARFVDFAGATFEEAETAPLAICLAALKAVGLWNASAGWMPRAMMSVSGGCASALPQNASNEQPQGPPTSTPQGAKMRVYHNAQNTVGITFWRTPKVLVINLGSRALYWRL